MTRPFFPNVQCASGAEPSAIPRSTRLRAAASTAWMLIALGGLMWGAVGVAAPAHAKPGAKATAKSSTGTAYRLALARFKAGDLQGAMRLLDDAPPGADVHNLRGAILMRQKQFERARTEFAAAAALDGSLWEAAYNGAEVDLREGRFAKSRQEFASLLARAETPQEREFVRYKTLLAGLMEGREDPVLKYLAQIDKRGSARPAGYFYLRAALARWHGSAAESARWLSQASAGSSGRTGRLYADSFRALGWKAATPAPPAERTTPPTPGGTSPARVAVVQLYRPSANPPPAAGGGDSEAEPLPASGGGPTPTGGRDGSPPISFRVGAAPPLATDPDGATPSGIGRAPVPFAAAAPPSRPSGGGSSSSARGGGGGTSASSPKPAPTAPPAPSDAFNAKYESAYRAYAQRDFATSLRFLEEAEEAQPGLADAANLRGLVFSRQRRFDEAEASFRKAVAADPTFWAAKFNLAELPFGYKNYTEARKRFESLFAETDRVTQPREAELTEFKVFLTLLLEGKENAARSFVNRFRYEGSTPARYYAQAALDFHDGKFDRAIESVNAAKKVYPAPLEAIFAESFYRIGWLTDGSAPTVAAAAAETPASPPAVTPEPSPAASATPEAPAQTVTAAATTPTPPPLESSTPEPAAPPAVLAVVPTPGSGTSASPTPVPSTAPVTADTTPPPPRVASAPVSLATPPAVDSAISSPEAPSPASEPPEARSTPDHAIRVVLPLVVLLYVLGTTALMVRTVRRVRRGKTRRRPRVSYPPSDIVQRSKV